MILYLGFLSVRGWQVDQILDQVKLALEFAWDKARQEAGGHVTLLAAVAAVVLLLWLFLLPGVKKKG